MKAERFEAALTMPQRVPILEFLHELNASGIQVDLREALDRPQHWWERLPADRRALFLARRQIDAQTDAALRVRVVKRRGRPALAENVLLELQAQEQASLRDVVIGRLLGLGFETLATESEADVEALRVPETVFREVAAPRGVRPTLPLLDAAWTQEPWDLDRRGPLARYDDIPGFSLVERYWADEGLAEVAVLRDEEDGSLVYHTEEPRLTEMEKAILVTLNERLRDVLVQGEGEVLDPQAHMLSRVFELMRAYRFRVDQATSYKIGYYFLRNYLGFGRIEPLMRDPHIEDISCNGVNLPIFVAHGRHQSIRSNVMFDEMELNSFTIKMAQRGGRTLSLAQPMVDATLPGGSRLQACLGREVTSRGSSFTIRKFREDPLTAVDLIRYRTHGVDTMAYLWLAVELRCSLLVMGATASGKTTTLNCLSQFVPPTMKIVTIEDTREITLQHENWLAAVTRESANGLENERITMYDLLRASLRQRPEYIIVGEIRGEEGLTLFQAMSTGHTCFSTMHAGSVDNAVYRLENPPIQVPRVMLTSLDFFLLQGQVDLHGRPARRMISLTEVNGLDSQTRNLRLNEIYKWESSSDAHQMHNLGQVLDQARHRRGWTRSRLEEELQARSRVLQRLVERNERHYSQVASAIRTLHVEQEGRNVNLVPTAGKPA